MQSKKHSLIEVLTDILVGYVMAIATQTLVFPIYGIQASLSQNMKIGLWFMGVALIRKYVIRRAFTKLTEKIRSSKP